MIDKIIEDLGNDIIRVNLDPDRWYVHDEKYYPSVTWILESYPKDIGFYIWLANQKSYAESRQIMRDAGDRGSRVHNAVERLLRNETVKFTDVMFENNETFTPEDWTYISSFMNFYKDYPLTVLNLEETVIEEGIFGEEYGGTCDFRGQIRMIDDSIKMPRGSKEVYYITNDIILDWKTSAAIYPTHYMQIAAYAKCLNYSMAGVVRLGTKSKRGYEIKTINAHEIDHYYKLFQAVYVIWQDQNQGAEPRYKEFKSELKLEIPNVEKDDNQENNERQSGEDQNGDQGTIESGEGNPKEPRLF